MGRLGTWFGAHPLRPAFAAMAFITLLGSCASMLEPPRQDRNWYPYLSRTPDVSVTGTSFEVTPVSDWSYNADGPIDETYVSAEFDIADLRSVWFMLEPQPGSQLAAHTLLLFEFEGDRLLGLTIEARREEGEEYDALAGIWNTFELSYIWASARDLLVRRAVMLDHEIFVYPVAIDDEQKRTLLTRLLARTEALETQPRYYNTIFSNCTNELAKAAGFNWAPAFILTGRSDEYLFRRAIIPGRTFAEAHERSDVTEFVQALNEAPAEIFDAQLLAELRRRNTGDSATIEP
ncbi:membrane protein [alpha proteobacterium U9-1i]|nr:membrane protein [alpha proteobacterium U9-1i]